MLLLKKIALIVMLGIQVSGSPIKMMNTTPPDDLVAPWEECITQNELDMMAKLVYVEAGNQDLKGKRLVADVIINRIESERFPDTVEGVIYQKNAFTPVQNGFYERCSDNMVTKECYDAVIIEYTSLRMNDGIVFFSSTETSANGVNEFKHGDHWFSY